MGGRGARRGGSGRVEERWWGRREGGRAGVGGGRYLS